jgi:hypothetical protein
VRDVRVAGAQIELAYGPQAAADGARGVAARLENPTRRSRSSGKTDRRRLIRLAAEPADGA